MKVNQQQLRALIESELGDLTGCPLTRALVDIMAERLVLLWEIVEIAHES